MNETTGSREYSTLPDLYLAFELGNQEWKLGFTIGLGQNPRRRTIKAGDLEALQREIGLAKQRFGLPEGTKVLSCYEAGRDGFWLHRYLVSQAVENLVVDSASIEVNRRAKRAKTDRLDVEKLVAMLIRYDSGEQKVWCVVHVPSVAAEDNRHLHRALKTFKSDRTRHDTSIVSRGCWWDKGCGYPWPGIFWKGWHGFGSGTGDRCHRACVLGYNKNMPVTNLWMSRLRPWRLSAESCSVPPRSRVSNRCGSCFACAALGRTAPGCS